MSDILNMSDGFSHNLGRSLSFWMKLISSQKVSIHFNLTHLDLLRRQGLSRTGEPVIQINSTSLNSAYSMMIFTSLLGKQPIALTLREDSNTQYDFAAFVFFLLEKVLFILN